MSSNPLKKGGLALFAIFLLAGMTVTPVAASNTAINYDSSAAPQPELVGDVTIADHQLGDNPLAYNNNEGEWTSLPASVNETPDNPYSFVATDVSFADAGAFPHANDSVSALNATFWGLSGDNSTKLSTSDSETADGVNAVQIATDGTMAAGDSATAAIDLTSADIDAVITSDEEKRYLQLVMDVNTLDTGTVVDVRAVDEDGDYYSAEINTSRTSGEDFVTNATGEGIIYQQQLGELTLTQVGDGTFNDIQTLEFVVQDGDFDGEVSALNLDKMGAWDFGDELKDTDDDDELETLEIKEHKAGGALELSDLGSMGPTFSDAHIKSLTVPFEMSASDLDSEDVDVGFSPAEQYSNYESHFEGDFRFQLPEQYDLSYANLAFQDTQSLPDSRYVSVEYAEGTGDTAFADIESWSSISSSYSSIDAEITVDDTVQPGTAMVLSYDYVVTEDEQTNLEDTSVPIQPPEDDGGILDMIFSIYGAGVAVVLGVVQKVRGGWPFSG